MDADKGRERLVRETNWIEARGGQQWTQAYVKPFYMTMQGFGWDEAEANDLFAQLRARALELPLADIRDMLSMQWRLQAAGAWFAISRADPSLSEAVHRGFEFCFGTLTAPSLTVAALTYPNDSTREVLTRYGDRDVTHHYGASGIIDAALRRLDADSDPSVRTSDDDYLDALLERSVRAQTG